MYCSAKTWLIQQDFTMLPKEVDWRFRRTKAGPSVRVFEGSVQILPIEF